MPPPAKVFSMGYLGCWLLITLVWSLTPIAWMYFISSVTCPSKTILTLLPSVTHRFFLKYVNPILTSLAGVEVIFSIYHFILVRRLQKRLPFPRYTRRFVRSVFKRALETGMRLDVDHTADVGVKGGAEGSAEGQEEVEEDKKGEELPSAAAVTASAAIRPNGDGTGQHSFNLGPPQTYELRKRSLSQAARANGHGKRGRSLSFVPLYVRNELSKDDPRAVDFRNQFKCWFHGFEFEDVGKENVLEWLAWSLYGYHLEEIYEEESELERRRRQREEGLAALSSGESENETREPSGQEAEGNKLDFLNYVVSLVEARGGMEFQPGRNPKVKTVRLTIDPVRITSRPFLFYLSTWAFNHMTRNKCRKAGFEILREEGLEYLIRVPEGWNWEEAKDVEEKRPLLFLHGLGMGLAQYGSLIQFLRDSPALHDRPIIVLIQPNISMNLFHPDHLRPPTKDFVTRGLISMLRRHGFEESGLTVLSHSNGTIVHGWLLKSLPEVVRRSCFIDPVCFCLWEPDVCFNFLYKTPETGIELLMRYFVGTEAGIALTLQRHFDWSVNILWFDEIPNPYSPYHSSFFLAGKDAILNCERVRRYLTEHGVRMKDQGGGMKVEPNMSHGETLIAGGTGLRDVLSWLEGNVAGLGGDEEDA